MRSAEKVSSILIELPACRVLVTAEGDAVTGVTLDPGAKALSGCAKSAGGSGVLKEASGFFASYAAGRAGKIPKLDLSGYTENEKAVLSALCRVGFGETVSYGGLAAAAGLPNAARFVGTVMRKNRFPLIVPCHRVILSSGAIGNYSSGGSAVKRRLLEFEKSMHAGSPAGKVNI